jgi:LPP20 lipoprotein
MFIFASPAWMFNLEHDKNDIIGYGMDTSLSKAKQNAMMDITHSISVSVESNVDISTRDNNGKASSNSSVDSHTRSKAILSGVEFIKIEQNKGLWWVAAKYDNSPLEIKFRKALPKTLKDESQNRYLKNTPLGKSIDAELNYKLNYKVVRKDNLWQLKYKDILVPINQRNFYKLFSNQKTKTISMKANQKIYVKNDKMFFEIQHEKNGYISILYVEHNGKVGILLANKKSRKSFKYPDAKNEDVFTIANPYGKTIRELYVTIHSQEPISLHQFEDVSHNLLDDSNYAFEKLVSLLHRYNYSTYAIKIR